ncbi:MAG: hypothetical protein ACRDS9_09040, partial [Pseudonocardiaceae bacterium]
RQDHYEEHEPAESPGGRVRSFLDSAEPVGVQTGHPPTNTTPPTSSAADEPGPDGGVERAGLLNDVAGLRDEWQRVQGAFVDDPSRAVHEASMLIDRTLDEIRMNVGGEHPSETTSTEELRVRFQRYREFFQRLLSV